VVNYSILTRFFPVK